MDQPPNTRMTDVTEFLSSLRGGVFEQKVAAALSDTALGVINTGKAGTVTLTFSLKQIAESNQVNCSHKLAFVMPTKNGKQAQEDTTDTPLYVNRGGRISIFPENQTQMFDVKGNVNSRTTNSNQE